MNRIDQPVEFFSLFRMLPEAIFHASPAGVRRKDAPNNLTATAVRLVTVGKAFGDDTALATDKGGGRGQKKLPGAIFRASPEGARRMDAPSNLTATAVRLVTVGKAFGDSTELTTDEGGGRGQNRTADTRIFNPLLYQLSYPARETGENRDAGQVLARTGRDDPDGRFA